MDFLENVVAFGTVSLVVASFHIWDDSVATSISIFSNIGTCYRFVGDTTLFISAKLTIVLT